MENIGHIDREVVRSVLFEFKIMGCILYRIPPNDDHTSQNTEALFLQQLTKNNGNTNVYCRQKILFLTRYLYYIVNRSRTLACAVQI